MYMRDVNLVVNAFHRKCLNVDMSQHFHSSVAGGRDRSFFPWFQPWVRTQICFCAVVHWSIVVPLLFPLHLYWNGGLAILSGSIYHGLPVSALVSSVRWLGSGGCCSMSESSDTTHEAILHNLVSHQRVLQRQIGEVSQDIQELKQQLSALIALVNQVVTFHFPSRARC